MRTVTVREMRRVLTRVDDLLRKEGEILITRRGKPVARLLPVPAAGPMPSHADLRARMPRLSEGSEVTVRKDRDGR